MAASSLVESAEEAAKLRFLARKPKPKKESRPKPGVVSHFLNFPKPRGPRTPTFGPIDGVPIGTR